jgi:hypothetical protein
MECINQEAFGLNKIGVYNSISISRINGFETKDLSGSGNTG